MIFCLAKLWPLFVAPLACDVPKKTLLRFDIKVLKKQCFRDNMWVILVWSFVNVQNKIYNTFLKTITSEVINSDRSLSNITFILEAKEPLTHVSLSARQQAVDCFDKRSSTGRCVLLFQALEQFNGIIWQIIWPAVLWFQGLILHIT